MKFNIFAAAAILFVSGFFFEIYAQNISGEWRLTEMTISGNKTALDSEKLPTLTFDTKNRAFGYGGCNHYSTTYRLRGKSITFKPIISTKMACLAEVSSLIEINYLNTLSSVESYKFSGKNLILADKKGAKKLSFTRIK